MLGDQDHQYNGDRLDPDQIAMQSLKSHHPPLVSEGVNSADQTPISDIDHSYTVSSAYA